MDVEREWVTASKKRRRGAAAGKWQKRLGDWKGSARTRCPAARSLMSDNHGICVGGSKHAKARAALLRTCFGRRRRTTIPSR
eukprot:6205680-Pleurochrysis_carterae.AAC.2